MDHQYFFFSSRRRHTRCSRDWSSDVCSSDLRPSADRPGGAARVPAEVIERIVRGIGLGENGGSVWVDFEGRWQIGPKTGRWTKPAAEHIGQAAREAARLRRLEELDRELEVSERVLARIHVALGEIDEQEAAAKTEAALAPDDSGVRSAVAKRDAHRQQLMQRTVRLQEAEVRVSKAREMLERKIAERDATAADLGLRAWIDDLRSLEDALQEYQQELISLWRPGGPRPPAGAPGAAGRPAPGDRSPPPRTRATTA